MWAAGSHLPQPWCAALKPRTARPLPLTPPRRSAPTPLTCILPNSTVPALLPGPACPAYLACPTLLLSLPSRLPASPALPRLQVKSAINSQHNHEELLEMLRGVFGESIAAVHYCICPKFG